MPDTSGISSRLLASGLLFLRPRHSLPLTSVVFLELPADLESRSAIVSKPSVIAVSFGRELDLRRDPAIREGLVSGRKVGFPADSANERNRLSFVRKLGQVPCRSDTLTNALRREFGIIVRRDPRDRARESESI